MMDPIATKRVDQERWRAWRENGRDGEAKGVALRMKAGKWLLLVGLPAAAVLWFLLKAG